MGCTVSINRHGTLCYRLYWKNQDWKESSGLKNTPDNSKIVSAWAAIIDKDIRDGNFDYLKHFPTGNHAHLFLAQDQKKYITVREFFHWWPKQLTGIKQHTAKCYESWIRNHVLPTLGYRIFNTITTSDIKTLQTHLREKKVGATTINRTIYHAFRAMVRSAISEKQLMKSPFIRGELKREVEKEYETPDPYTPEERKKIIRDFWEDDRLYFPLVYFQFWVGTRLPKP